MANKNHVKMLRQGATIWNKWRKTKSIVPDLFEASLSNAKLTSMNLVGADLRVAKLVRANLDFVNLTGADLSGANFSQVSLKYANLVLANLSRVNLDGADLSSATFGLTIFGNLDLTSVIGLETAVHVGPSTVGTDTLGRSGGKIPEPFLRGCGVPEDFITSARLLVTNPIEYYSCFISYSSKDNAFADRLHADLQAKKIRCWYAPEDLKIGEKFRVRIDESIRIYDKVMIVLSENSIRSAWVEDEVEAALEREHKNPGSLVLFPIRLDNAVMETTQAWAASLRRTRHIGDFSNWKDHDSYQKAFERLLRDLKSQQKKHLTS